MTTHLRTLTFDPAKWRLVPVEPDEEMLVAGQEAWSRMRKSRPSIEDCDEANVTFRAMLAAAPEPAAGVSEDSDRLMTLLDECAPIVFAAAEAAHLTDGFRRRPRPLDGLADRVRAAIAAKGK